MANYRFVTTWQIKAPAERVWEAIKASSEWPRWWQGVLSVSEVRPGDEKGIGAVQHYVWKSKLPYKLAFDMEVTRSEPPRVLEGRASGELEGTGLWELEEAGGVTSVRYTWAVRTTQAWMNLLAPIARPLFAWNHDFVMANGATGLAQLLGAELLAK